MKELKLDFSTGNDPTFAHSLSPEPPEASVGLHVLGRPHRPLAAVRAGVTVNRGVAAGRAVVSFFKKKQKHNMDPELTEAQTVQTDLCRLECWCTCAGQRVGLIVLAQLMRSKLKLRLGLSLLMWAADAQSGEGGVALEALSEGTGGAGWMDVVQQTRERVCVCCVQSLSRHPAALPETPAITAVIKAKAPV